MYVYIPFTDGGLHIEKKIHNLIMGRVEDIQVAILSRQFKTLTVAWEEI